MGMPKQGEPGEDGAESDLNSEEADEDGEERARREMRKNRMVSAVAEELKGRINRSKGNNTPGAHRHEDIKIEMESEGEGYGLPRNNSHNISRQSSKLEKNNPRFQKRMPTSISNTALIKGNKSFGDTIQL
jgi:hypothetical protein